jgi:hypothetical protein
MAKEKHKEEMTYCPVARLFSDLENVFRKKYTFLEHLNSSRIEFLKAIRALLDQRIDSLEKMAAKRGKKMSKIEVG